MKKLTKRDKWVLSFAFLLCSLALVASDAVWRSSDTAVVRVRLESDSASPVSLHYNTPMLFSQTRPADVVVANATEIQIEIPAGRSVVEMRSGGRSKKLTIDAPPEPSDDWVLNGDRLTIDASFSLVDAL
ncbi:MAG: hypothetical protein JNK63_09130 [Chthonomonas sp.]|nr:hypothetical protein [Chthonomonas sp.]